MLHVQFAFENLPVHLAVGIDLHDPFGPEAGWRVVQRIDPRGHHETLVDEFAVVIEVIRQLHEEVPCLEMFAFAVQAATLEHGSLYFDWGTAAAADAVQIRHQLPWYGDHERKK
jgi:hypothetical protein